LQAVTCTSASKAGRTYTVVIDVPHYERRRVQIHFSKNTPTLPRITTDGPTESPHRYNETRICIWHPDDPYGSRWVFDDGLLVLLGLIAAHLFREAWWRETGEWLGPEASHAVSPDQQGENAA
jgi:hypothetical protein